MAWRIATVLLLVLLAILAAPAVRHLRETPPSPAAALRLTLDPPDDVDLGTGDEPFDLAFAPSGREVVFVGVRAGESLLWRRVLDLSRAEPVGGTSGATQPAYSHDGASVFFFAARKLRRVTLATGEHADVADAAAPAGLAIRGDGATLFVPAPGPIVRLTASGHEPATTLRAGERTHSYPAWIANTDAFVYLATTDEGRRTIRLHDRAEDVQLTRADSNAIVQRDHLLFVRDGALRAERLDVGQRRVGPRATTLAIDVGVAASGRGSFAADERLLAWASHAARVNVVRWFSMQGAPLAVVTEPGDYWQVRLSPDERSAALTMLDPLLRTLDVFRMPATGGSPQRVTLALAADTDPVWSPGGDRLAFRSLEDGQPEIYTSAGLLHASPLDEFPTDWTTSHLIFHARSPASGFDIWSLPRAAGPARPLVRSGFNEVDGRLSPDGRWIAYASDEPGQYDVYVAPFDAPGQRIRVSTAGGTRPQWAGNRTVVFLRGRELLRSDLELDPAPAHATTPAVVATFPPVRDYAVARRRQQVLAIVQTGAGARATMNVLVGWPGVPEP